MARNSTGLQSVRRLGERGRLAEALRRLDWELTLATHSHPLRLARARLREWHDEVDAALAECDELITENPKQADAWLTKGSLHARRGERMTALDAFRRARRHRPDWPAAEHLVTSMGGGGFEAPLRGEVTELFESYAERFDQHLVDDLGYRGHEVLPAAVRASGVADGARLRVLDLGCGTGLCGTALRPLAEWLGGVDLSLRSVALARSRGLYDLVWVADLVYALATTPNGDLDLLVAADVLGYLGGLEVVLTEARRTLRPEGRLAFTVEALEGSEDYRLGAARRFAYSERYLRLALARFGLAVRHHHIEPLRRENGRDVVAHVLVAAQEATK